MCIDCKRHQWCTRHDEAKYNEAFEQIKAGLVAECPKVVVSKNKLCGQKPKLGAFEIRHEKRLLFSKLKSQMFPVKEDVVQKIKSYFYDMEYGLDVTPYLIKQQQSTTSSMNQQQIESRNFSFKTHNGRNKKPSLDKQLNKYQLSKINQHYNYVSYNYMSNNKRVSPYKVRHISPFMLDKEPFKPTSLKEQIHNLSQSSL